MLTPTLPIYPSEKNPSLIKQLQTQLKAVGYKKIIIDGIFGRDTLTAVRAFQATNLDANHQPLYVDGIVGEKTWNALFAGDRKPSPHPSPLQQHALRFAIQQLGVQENPIGSNRGDQIDKYLKSVKAPAGVPWCAAFVYWCFQQASYEICTINPLIKTAHCLTHWIAHKVNESLQHNCILLIKATSNPAPSSSSNTKTEWVIAASSKK